jgi:hypothetical protein
MMTATMTQTRTTPMTTSTSATTAAPTMAARRRKEIAFLARHLFGQMRDLTTAIGELVPAELADGDGVLVEAHPLLAIAEQLDEAMLCFNLIQEELGLPAGTAPRYRK